ncbi:hypothetical protein RJ640_013466 [Escallonia rubra]|uniref:CCHC-type domain-containing protein n=1 Tax=Escallonia rubra TaxID=112253 RepID=A0AA88QI08_9ASTE|nr:hypothetical protein RJ640_013466 [Escallonia rubra]
MASRSNRCPFASTISASTTLSAASPYFRDSSPKPPPAMCPPIPTVGQDPAENPRVPLLDSAIPYKPKVLDGEIEEIEVNFGVNVAVSVQGEVSDVMSVFSSRDERCDFYTTDQEDTEERRATRFKNGLKYGIRKFLTAVTLDTYGQVLDKAQRVEKDVEVGRKYYRDQRQKRGREESSSRGKDVVQQPNRRNNNLAIKEPAQNTQKPTVACKTCGKNHSGVCYWESGACFNCQQQGHMIRDCPQPLKPQFIQVDNIQVLKNDVHPISEQTARTDCSIK